MTRKILKQIWVQRRENGWIFIEMIVISFFLWKAMDPVYTIISLNNLDKGYNPDKAFVLKTDCDNKEKETEDLNKIEDVLKLHPMIQNVTIAAVFTYPGTTAKTMYSFKSEKQPEWTGIVVYDANRDKAQDYLNIIGYKDVNTGMTPIIDNSRPMEDFCYISKMAAAKLFPDGSNPVGQKISSSNESLTVAGVIEDVILSFGEYEAMVIRFRPSSYLEELSYEGAEILLRLKDNVNTGTFTKSFLQKDAQKISTANSRITDIVSLDEIYSEGRIIKGVDGQIRLQLILSFFFIACAFLGIAGTIFMKCNRRRSEIGLYRAMGCTKNGILGMFYLESAILITLAFVISLIPLAAIILSNNEFMFKSQFFDMTINNSSPYPLYRFIPHFAIVSMITYAILMVTAFVGTYITAHKYSNLQPSEALRDE